MPFVTGMAKPLAFLAGLLTTVFADEIAFSAELTPDNVNGCWNSAGKADDGQTEITATLCFNSDDKYSLFTKACFHYPQEPNYPCEGWQVELSYYREGDAIKLQTLETHEAAEKSYCKQNVADFDQVKFIACFMPGVEWTKQPVGVEGK